MANVDFFLKIEGIDGESTDDKHKGEIQVESWSIGGYNGSSFANGTGGGVGKVELSDFKFVKKTDKASAKLFTYCCTGEHASKATLVCRKAGSGQQEFLTVVMSPVLVSNFQASAGADSEGATQGTAPVEHVFLSFGKIEFKYKEQKPDGSLGAEIIGGWDVTTNKKV